MKIGISSLKLSRNKSIESVLNGQLNYISYQRLHYKTIQKYDQFVSWGYGKYGALARKWAHKLGKQIIYLEDGFLRSPFISKYSQQSYSFVQDTVAPYYDYKKVTNLEKTIIQCDLSEAQKNKAQSAIDFMRCHHIGKFAILNDHLNTQLPEGFDQDSILIIDQVAGDLSLHYGGVDFQIVKHLYTHIKAQHPKQKIYLKVHPDVLAGKKRGCFDFLHYDTDVTCITQCHLHILAEKKPKIYVLTSLAGFEALLYGAQVHCFGVPWYSGYGLTQDHHPESAQIHKRRKTKDVLSVFYAAYIAYTHYIDPVSLKEMDILSVLHYFSRVKRHIQSMRGHVLAIGIRPWKKKDFLPWVKTPFNKVSYVDNFYQIHKLKTQKNVSDHDVHYKCVIWGYKAPKLIEKIKNIFPDMPIIRVEDGFIRSYGLGSDFIPPLSLNFDHKELYFHRADLRNSDFHDLCKSAPFDVVLRARAHSLAKIMIQHNISKYNIDISTDAPKLPQNRHIIFVPGQVPGDASLKYGGLPYGIEDDWGLLRHIRRDYPKSYILYKPHPDVTSKNRPAHYKGIIDTSLYDQKIIDISTNQAIDCADMVVTMTSQAGFEGLIRGKKVHCYGQAFYKDYGLCIKEDKRHQTIISLEDFIYVSLINYPLYMYQGDYITPETAIDMIIAQKIGKKDQFRVFMTSKKLLRYIYKLHKWICAYQVCHRL